MSPSQPEGEAVIIEEEPPHEFYANLVGRIPPPTTAERSHNAALERRSMPSSSSQDLVPPEETRALKDATKISLEAQVYFRELCDPPRMSALLLDKSNKGFKILASMGWKEEDGGLGKYRQGPMEPVKTSLKSDKKGLGMVKTDERVTHRLGQMCSKVTSADGKQICSRKRVALEADREKQRDKRARILLRDDIPVEYEGLYLSLA
uniref:G-patch domain-containing protein n=1 Tax=Pseudictyota dubia TaxID=2749911 RepID=A0A7R9WBN6_9STRA|mmetsp:Transcript_43160/g.80134  ORF Transcript_43160/g.80134 Transcript_43160/m.80134 type:complete len:206 (+) Transcript_43160:62-679(+)|eukprot:CAMPEP_0197466554 /NCGR_PEP_ID=MMETSP1175-20131217/65112_1 /TAXON_ID=1003142 /ORGANISM="Triceratium dubium, Strain CCMP147" /LENGTH=205 /DNA_ID=CAMNT_0043002603 /DNA_START=115 /DNA_END=732 /DNA_ORIENTATION=-